MDERSFVYGFATCKLVIYSNELKSLFCNLKLKLGLQVNRLEERYLFLIMGNSFDVTNISVDHNCCH